MSDLLIALVEMIAKAAKSQNASSQRRVMESKARPANAARAQTPIGAKPQAGGRTPLARRPVAGAPKPRPSAPPPAKKTAPAPTGRNLALATPAVVQTATHDRRVSTGIIKFLRPTALRSQYIMTEIFQAPVALRPERF